MILPPLVFPRFNLPANIKLGCKGLQGTNTLIETSRASVKISFITLTPGQELAHVHRPLLAVELRPEPPTVQRGCPGPAEIRSSENKSNNFLNHLIFYWNTFVEVTVSEQ